MIRVINTLVIGLLVQSLILGSSAESDNGNTLIYKATSNKRFILGSKTTSMSINAIVYLRPEDAFGNEVSITIKNVTISVQEENSEVIILNDCLSEEFIAALEVPFLGIFDSNGALINILVNKSEPQLVMNTKLFGASLLQINREQVENQSPRVSRRPELSFAGLCPTTSIISNNKNLIIIEKLQNLGQCTGVRKDRRSTSCLNNVCRPEETKNLKWDAKSNIQVDALNDQVAIKNLVFKENVNYNPFERSDEVLTFYKWAEVKLIGFTETAINPLDKENSLSVSRPIYPPVNENICKSSDNKNSQLKKLYSAMVCEQSFAIFYEDVIERAITCKSIN